MPSYSTAHADSLNLREPTLARRLDRLNDLSQTLLAHLDQVRAIREAPLFDIGDVLAEGGDALALQPLVFRAEIAVGLGVARQALVVAPASSARIATRIASSPDAKPCGVAAEMKLSGAAATIFGSRASASGESKLQLIRSTPASAAAAASGVLTWMWVRTRWPLTFYKS